MKKIKFPLVVIAILIAVAGAFASNQKNTHVNKAGDVLYHYTSNSDQLADMQNPSNWVVEATGCNSSGDIPCGIIYSDVREDFDEYLLGFGNATALTSAADERKYKPAE